ncbi:hypothetical protein EKO04_010950 [Ascochyta lentis]|uniref:Fungal N-terminal domain-containing protein n=1 Tax=Ascochyta lentis TaxID=205686 RepID=A0A8H7MCT4_9PLEO|nr:hypothetical protein EKO04_010950 [Ascochyta lentis]
MSGAFEVAAGAFAVVGVTDVIVRAGRDLYNFLRDIEDAPVNAQRLCDSIAETVLLASASKRCLLELKTQNQSAPVVEVVDTLSSALKSLDRELKSLKFHTTKCKGSTKRWSNIRYALSEQRINKALSSLERSKSLLTNTLTLACRELTSVENQQTERLIQQVVSKTVDLTQAVNARFDANEQSLATRLDALQQHNLATQTSHRHALNARLDAHHRELITAHKLHQDSLTVTRRAQISASSSQNRLLRVSTQTNRRTALISQDMRAHNQASDKQHQQTRDLVIASFRDLQILQNRPMPKATTSGRQVMYFGEQRDLIMPALYSIKKELAVVFDQLFTNHCQEVSPSHIAWLQSEFQNLVASAAQEEAASHPMSTATSFDTWLYSRETNKIEGSLKEQSSPISNPHQSGKMGPVALQRGRKRPDRAISFKTPSGTIRVRLPRRIITTSATDTFEEVGFSFFSASGESFAALHASFIRAKDHYMAPTICAQLQTFVLAGKEYLGRFYHLLRDGTFQEFDSALRSGTISLYHVHGEFPGLNIIFYFATCYGREDILRYLESQGVGSSTLRQNQSVSLGLWWYLRQNTEPTFKSRDAILGTCVDDSTLLADLVMLGLSEFNTTFDDDRFLRLFGNCLQRLHMDNPIDLHGRKISLETAEGSFEMIPGIVRFLLETGADPNAGDLFGLSLIGSFLTSALFKKCITTAQGHMIRKQVLNALIESGADVLHRDRYGYTAAQWAWDCGHWDPWCEALQENGLSVQEVDTDKEQGWALRTDESDQGDVNTEAEEDPSDSS